MLKKIEQIEEIMNRLLQKLGAFLQTGITNATPSKIKKAAQQGQKAIKAKTTRVTSQARSSKDLIKGRINSAKTKSTQAVQKAQVQATELAVKARETKIREIQWKKVFAAVLAIFAPFLAKIKSFWASLQPQTVVAIVTIGTVGSLTGINIYKKSREIAEKSREPASAEEVAALERANAISKRPGYFKKTEKAFTITNVVLPVYFDTHTSSNNHQTSTGIKKSDLRKLVIDFTFVSSNKYIRSFFWDDNNTYLIMDRLNTTIEPIAIEFPLEEEGKIIIREKLVKEMNKLIKDLKIKGQIDDVYIHSIIGA